MDALIFPDNQPNELVIELKINQRRMG